MDGLFSDSGVEKLELDIANRLVAQWALTAFRVSKPRCAISELAYSPCGPLEALHD